ncbi:uncharacterized protein SCHCODRAFT_02314405 [Schizophyllum commune H4-8]|uniref:uncharacterized protein n=1 Tax=Schizophyllum commune (strain H4-8 / FGSC 9210) TaxID=578458 RepID=UPI0021607C4C|nr:uncharacterized protein SCHCODRAFT_02314405 [Schizophyllum commune H4-8]KAI5891277.1 hypothetical protein SCHCODRAFT_02314405 [Schizophyllum commune H4-8]
MSFTFSHRAAMVNSAISSDPLSSPSPSPEPPSGPSKPPEIRREIPMSSEAPHGRGGDNDSELSELTEDEQDRRSQSKKRASVHQPSVSSVKPSSRKRAPAADDDDKEYETEEEQDTRRNDKGGDEDDAMQEDEDGADDDADDSAKSSGKETDRTKDLVKGRRVPNRPPRPRSKKRNSIVPAPMWGWATKNDEEDEVEEGEQPEEEEEEGEVGEDDNEREEPEPEEDTAPPSARMPPPPATNADDFLRQEIEKRQADINNSRETPKVPAKPSVESEDEDEMEEGEIEEGDESDNDEDVGVAAPRTAPLMAASSIMAGSTVVGSTLMDDGGSDEEEEEGEKEDEDKDSDDDEAKDKGKDEDMDIDEDDTPPAKSNKEAPVPTSTKPISKKKEIVDETPVKDGRRSRIIKPASAQEQSREPSPDAASAAEDDALEQDQEDETEIQPAHRAEALDTLAIIELKFALLRENVYVEKMDNLAWEEALVNDGTHPEMLHMQSELTKRRDTRMRLADARQEVETQAVQRKRAHDEMAIWSWWQFERDQLQTDMISETNRKRRRLERDRRTLERPPPSASIIDIHISRVFTLP